MRNIINRKGVLATLGGLVAVAIAVITVAYWTGSGSGQAGTNGSVTLKQRQLAIWLPFLLEAGYSARASADYQEMTDEFDLLFPTSR